MSSPIAIIVGAVIIAGAIVVAFRWEGTANANHTNRYQIAADRESVYILDRWAGTVTRCYPPEDGERGGLCNAIYPSTR